MQTTLAAVLSIAALAAAAPLAPVVTPFAKRGITEASVTIVNMMASAVSTSIASNPGVPGISGYTAPGTLGPQETATVVVPQNWAGNVALADAKNPISGGASLIEPSLSNWNGGTWMLDIDVSYVNGYTVSATCHCNEGNAFLSGCSTDLWTKSNCTTLSSAQECINPSNNGSFAATSAPLFFQPCQGKAYTFPADNNANNGGSCTSGAVTCCVGTEADGCPAPPS